MIRKYTEEGLDRTLSELRAVFDLVRLVNPVHMTVESCTPSPVCAGAAPGCFALWQGTQRCLNCIGLRALQEEKRQSKYEYAGKELYHVVSLPVEFNNRQLALQMINKVDDPALTGAYRDELMNRVSAFNAQLNRDAATGLYNKRFFDDRLPFLCRRALVNGEDVAVAMLDVDGLESLAAEYGQQASDEAVIAVGRLLCANVSRRRGDFVARYGTNTFAIVLCDMPRLLLRERLAELVQRLAALRLAGYAGVRLKNAMGVFRLSDNRSAEVANIAQTVARRVEIARAAGLNRIAFQDR